MAYPHGCQCYTATDQRNANGMIDVEGFTKEHYGKDAAKNRHEMPGQSRPRRTDQFDTTIEQQVRDK